MQQDTGGGNLLHSWPLRSHRLFLSRQENIWRWTSAEHFSPVAELIIRVPCRLVLQVIGVSHHVQEDSNSEGDLSVSVSSISASVTTPVEVLAAIWKKDQSCCMNLRTGLHEHVWDVNVAMVYRIALQRLHNSGKTVIGQRFHVFDLYTHVRQVDVLSAAATRVFIGRCLPRRMARSFSGQTTRLNYF